MSSFALIMLDVKLLTASFCCAQGDDGSGVICDERLSGIMSFSYSSEYRNQTFYTNVYNYVDWIESAASGDDGQGPANVPFWAIYVIIPVVLVFVFFICWGLRKPYQRVRANLF